MKEIFLKTARRSGAPEIDGFEKVVEDAAVGQRSVVEELLNRDLITEEEFLRCLSEELNLPWEDEIKPIGKRKLREVCSAQLALKYRLLPLSFGDGSELIEEPDPDDASATQEVEAPDRDAVGDNGDNGDGGDSGDADSESNGSSGGPRRVCPVTVSPANRPFAEVRRPPPPRPPRDRADLRPAPCRDG